MLLPPRIKHPEIRPPKPEVGIEFHRLAGIIESFMFRDGGASLTDTTSFLI